MAGRLQEWFKTAGVIFSVIVSIFSFTFTFLTFYFEHLRTSEAVDAFVTNFSMSLDSMGNLEGMTFDLLLINKGDNSITASELWFEFDIGLPPCNIRKAASKVTEDALATPIFLPPMQASNVMLRFTLEHVPKGGYGIVWPLVSGLPLKDRLRQKNLHQLLRSMLKKCL